MSADTDIADEALQSYLGWNSSASPNGSWAFPDAPTSHSAERARVDDVMRSFRELAPDWSTGGLDDDLLKGGAWARAQMKARHPWLTDGSLDALEWAFTFAWR